MRWRDELAHCALWALVQLILLLLLAAVLAWMGLRLM